MTTETIAQYLGEDHRRCDRLLAGCEQAIAERDWARAETAAGAFQEALLHHFLMEEEVLFPDLETTNPASQGPTRVMRMEHRQMRLLLTDLATAVRARDREDGLGALETLHLLSQQHNTKEEGVLYPIADATFGARARDMTERLQAT